MSNAKDRIRASAERAQSAAKRVPEPTPDVIPEREQSVAMESPQPATKKREQNVLPPLQRSVRKNVDLSPDQNDRLGDWQRAAARDLGVARVTAQEILVVLVERLLADETLSNRVKRDVLARR
ncbi:UNVERIFIED_ORG: hypothetical protein M2328_006370 [Rhodococcus erythropolis]|uniref:hypothetical protein n=1 Tax=Rhodococcus erythropolis TaxID=1833 RepID=UPI0020160963|nr:hypothetical protein [Rhodococcus erythropolis]